MTKVTLRGKRITGNRLSLFLDFYPGITDPRSGKRVRREFLNMTVFSTEKYQEKREITEGGNRTIIFEPDLGSNGKPKPIRLKPQEKLHNEKMYELGEQIRLKRELEIQNNEYGFIQKEIKNGDFVEYFRQLPAERHVVNMLAWRCVLNHLVKFKGEVIRFGDINEAFCNSFKEYLLSGPSLQASRRKVANNTAWSYFNIFLTAVRQAQKKGKITKNITDNIEKIKKRDTHREFLSEEELVSLAKTDCRYPLLKNAALFSALTGLRFSDIQKLTWREVRYDANEGYSLHYTQKKTWEAGVLPISDEAYALLGKPGNPDAQVFTGLVYSAANNYHLKKWMMTAGLKKELSFHCFRHTFATLQLQYGTDIYTVSKMLGHRSVRTTEGYAKVIDAKKREASQRITLTRKRAGKNKSHTK